MVVRDPDRLSSERLPEDGFSARGLEPVAAEAQGDAGLSVGQVGVDAVGGAVDDGVRYGDRGLFGDDGIRAGGADATMGDDQSERRGAERRAGHAVDQDPG